MISKFFQIFVIILLLFSFSASSQWYQLGNSIYGDAPDDEFGFCVSTNSIGDIIAVSGWKNDDSGSNAGQVKVFQLEGGTWNQLGGDIDGEAADDNSGFSLSLNSEGNILAIGAQLNDGSDWVQLGSDIDGESFGDNSGSSVSLNTEGNIVVSVNENGSLEIFDANARPVYTNSKINAEENLLINIDSFSKGIYIIRFTTLDTIIYDKLILE